ncbi:MAG: hypothetical protein Tsb0021_15750 [Chlamydiales bacterium]
MSHEKIDSTLNQVTIFSSKPRSFDPEILVVACYLEFQQNLLLLKRSPGKVEGERWGVPAGKLEKGEEPLQAIIRETYEETGVLLSDESVHFLKEVYIRKPQVDYSYCMFYVRLKEYPKIILNHEHTEYQWININKVQDLPLMTGALEVLSYFKQIIDHE